MLVLTVSSRLDRNDRLSRFKQAMVDSKSLPEKPDNATLLQLYALYALYALYRQANSGAAQGTRPGFADMVGRVKWDAWNTLQGKDGAAAMQEYIDLIESLK